jgi:hypothetical protein
MKYIKIIIFLFSSFLLIHSFLKAVAKEEDILWSFTLGILILIGALIVYKIDISKAPLSKK